MAAMAMERHTNSATRKNERELLMHTQAHLHMKQTPSAKNDPILGRCNLPGCHNTGCNQKCGICRTAHYCGSVHQRRDWNRHKSECQPVQPRLREDIALALPQLACAHKWIKWYQEYAPIECDLVVTNAALGEDRPDNSVLSIIIMTRDNYKTEWGQKAVTEFAQAMVLDGRPPLRFLRVQHSP